MKKTIIILLLILVAMFAVLSALGRGGEYAAERLLYHAMKVHSRIRENPDVAPPKLLASVQSDLERVVNKYPKAATAKTAHIKLAEFYIFAQKYDEASSAIDVIMKKYADDPVALSMAHFLRGSMFEKQDRWEMALKEFDILKNKYTNTQLGMEVPLYIARHYRKKGTSTEAANAYNNAARFYERIGSENKGKMLGYVASAMLFETYMETKEHEKAGEALEKVLTDYPTPVAYSKLLPYVEYIYIEKLSMPEKAIELYKTIQATTKDERFKRFLGQRIETLKEPKK